MNSQDFDLIMFDLGGVLVQLTGVDRMIEWTQGLIPVEDLWVRWLASPGVKAFETGKSTPEDFSIAMKNEFDLTVGPEQFIKEFAGWSNSLYPGVTELLEKLSSSRKLVSLSNTNCLHWNYFLDNLEFLDYFDFNFPSHQTGFVKPDAEAFLNVVDTLECPAERILFFDDTHYNIESAKNLGIEAVHVMGVEQVIERLSNMGILEEKDLIAIH